MKKIALIILLTLGSSALFSQVKTNSFPEKKVKNNITVVKAFTFQEQTEFEEITTYTDYGAPIYKIEVKKSETHEVVLFKIKKSTSNNSNVSLKIEGIKYPNDDNWYNCYCLNIERSDRSGYQWKVKCDNFKDYYFNY